MSKSTELSESDVRAMIHLLAEVAALEKGHEERKRALMNGLCDLIEADYWVWALATKLVPGEQPIYTAMATGGFEQDQFPKLLVAFEHPDLVVLTERLATEVIDKGSQITRLRDDYDPDDFFTQCAANPLFLNADVGAPLLTFRPIQNQCVSAIGIYRQFSSAPFSDREAKIAHIMLSEVEWLHEQGWPWSTAVQVPHLPLRCRLVLNLLLEGLSRKLVADEMNISIHTVNGYVKQIYEYFEVNSHAGLVAKFRAGGSRDGRNL